MKVCKNCNQEKSLDDFYRYAGLIDGRANTCKVCKNKSTKKWRGENKEAYNAYMRQKNKDRYPDARLARYGLTNAWYLETLANQGHKCALCLKPNPSSKRTLAVDHCHRTGKVRGLLCYGCNRLMVLIDNPELLSRAIAYSKETD